MTTLSDRRSAAKNPSTPAEVLRQLAEDEDWLVKWRVARNPSAPADVLRLLAEDKRSGVRQSVAGNPSTPADLLAKLSKSRSSNIRLRLAGNPSTPSEVLAELSCDSDEKVAGIASRALAWCSLESCGGTDGMNREEFMEREC